jgi:hypothetical protein
MKPSTELIQFVMGAKLPWLYYDEGRGRLVLIIDNHLLSTYRRCPQYFMHYAVVGIRRKAQTGAPEREWFFDFGILFHKMMEEYYRNNYFKNSEFSLEKFAIDRAFYWWNEMNMNVHLTHEQCQQMGGYPGFAGMLVQYATQFKKENENLRVLQTEVAFGKNKVVPIYVWESDHDDPDGLFCHADIYLAGRYDIIADDGFYIIPLDHKTLSSFRGDPMSRFIIDDGPTGYIYALNKILPTIKEIPPELILKRKCNRISMNLISKSVPKEGSRFKRLPIYKSEAQLEAYRQRQIATCNDLLGDLDAYVRSLGVPRDTSKCTAFYFIGNYCQYFDVCRQADKESEQATIQNGYQKLPIWNTESLAENGE